MPSDSGLKLLSFPKQGLTQEDRQRLAEQAVHIDEMCISASASIEHVHHGVCRVLFEMLDALDLDCWTLCQILDERPSVVNALLAKNPDCATTERMMEILQRLRA